MSEETKQNSCARCKAYLFEDDDIVYCPVCGAPHHRDCYNSAGHCALEELHGTDKQYDKLFSAPAPQSSEPEGAKEEELKTCSVCGEKYSGELKRCPKCMAPQFAQFVEFDFLGGVPADSDIGDGITAEEAKKFIVSNTQRYIPKFVSLNKENKTSWNWGAFLLPCPWFFSRKMYKSGFIAGLITVISVLFSYPLSHEFYRLGLDTASDYTESARLFMQRLPEISKSAVIFSLISVLFALAVRLVSALFGDYIYKGYTVSSIKKMRVESSDMEHDYRKKGGVSLLMFLLSFAVIENLPSIIIELFL